ncbi:type VI secretion system baseplate subunit TssF [Rubrivivax gelatinosus]|nr:type VI secretion system baseplate subunit TssF [Rubrivivax gelatinosus]
MDPQLTRLYQDELLYLKELGQEFAREHPKIAARLGLEGMEVADPYVERLLEGFAFLTARVRLKLDAEQPQLIAQLLEALYPGFLAPLPSMMVARLLVDPSDPNLVQGHRVPRGSALHATLARGQDTFCEFRTAAELTLWPLEIVQVQYFSQAPDLGLGRWPPARDARGGLRIRLRAGQGLSMHELGLDRLACYISAPEDVALRLHELVLGTTVGTLAGAPAEPLAARWRDAASVRPLGFGADEALLPETARRFSGHRLLQEAAAFPQRLLFFEIGELRTRLAGVRAAEAELVLLFGRGDPALEAMVDAASLALHCTPAVNLFPKRLDRVLPGPGAWDYHAVADRTRPMDYEVHAVQGITGYGADGESVQRFEPLYHWRHDSVDGGHGWYTVRREPRQASQRQRQAGARVPTYLGDEVFVSLLDPGQGPCRATIRQLSIEALVSNRDLPVLLPQALAGGAHGWRLDTPGPVQAVQCLAGPTRPIARQASGSLGWQLVAQLTHEHLALGEGPAEAEANAAMLRDTLRLHGPGNDLAWQRLVEGVRALKAIRSVRRLPLAGPLSFGSGLALTLQVDEQAFQGASAFLLGSVLEAWLARHASVNSFTQLTLDSAQRGTVMRWPVRMGAGALA